MREDMVTGHVASTLEHLCNHWETRRTSSVAEVNDAPPASAVTIALAREAGTPGTSLAREVGHRLGWPVYDHELVEHIAQEMGLRASLLESVDEKHVNWLLESIESLAGAPGTNQHTYVRRLVETMAALSMHGHCVIVGRGAAQILPALSTLRVRLVAPLEDRIANVSKIQGLSLREAVRRVAQIDRDRAAFVRDHFHLDVTDTRNYHLVLNSSRFSLDECAGVIVTAVHQMEADLAKKHPRRRAS
jgi:cytidylate kinase